MKKLRTELDLLAKLNDSSTPFTFEKAQSLPYLQAVVKESLRMHPATGYTMPRVVPPGGVVIAGRFFPEKVSFRSRLVLSVSPIQRITDSLYRP
jgi:hypothetical protein